MTRPAVVLSFLASLLLAMPVYAVDELSEIDDCRDFSLIAKEVMTARQKKRPMSETLPKTVKKIESWAEKYGLTVDSEMVEETATMLVIPAYDRFAWPSDSGYNENRQDAISDFENHHFEECYTGLTSD